MVVWVADRVPDDGGEGPLCQGPGQPKVVFDETLVSQAEPPGPKDDGRQNRVQGAGIPNLGVEVV